MKHWLEKFECNITLLFMQIKKEGSLGEGVCFISGGIVCHVRQVVCIAICSKVIVVNVGIIAVGPEVIAVHFQLLVV
jgi:hypothetical protein